MVTTGPFTQDGPLFPSARALQYRMNTGASPDGALERIYARDPKKMDPVLDALARMVDTHEWAQLVCLRSDSGTVSPTLTTIGRALAKQSEDGTYDGSYRPQRAIHTVCIANVPCLHRPAEDLLARALCDCVKCTGSTQHDRETPLGNERPCVYRSDLASVLALKTAMAPSEPLPPGPLHRGGGARAHGINIDWNSDVEALNATDHEPGSDNGNEADTSSVEACSIVVEAPFPDEDGRQPGPACLRCGETDKHVVNPTCGLYHEYPSEVDTPGTVQYLAWSLAADGEPDLPDLDPNEDPEVSLAKLTPYQRYQLDLDCEARRVRAERASSASVAPPLAPEALAEPATPELSDEVRILDECGPLPIPHAKTTALDEPSALDPRLLAELANPLRKVPKGWSRMDPDTLGYDAPSESEPCKIEFDHPSEDEVVALCR